MFSFIGNVRLLLSNVVQARTKELNLVEEIHYTASVNSICNSLHLLWHDVVLFRRLHQYKNLSMDGTDSGDGNGNALYGFLF